MKASEVRVALRKAFAAPEYALLFEVADATGARHTRFADAIAMNLWPSRGLTVHGMEIKVDKYDWKRELQNPKKAEAIYQYCDLWSVVTPENGVIDDVKEIPLNWGWIVVRDDGLIKTVKQPERNEAKPLDRLFVAALLRNASKADDAEVNRMIEERVARLRALDKDEIDREVKRRISDNDHALKRLQLIRDKLGGDYNEWLLSDEEFALAVAFVIRAGVTKTYSGVLSIYDDLKRQAEHIEGVFADLNLDMKRPNSEKLRRHAQKRRSQRVA